jgi:hypothetical protein
MLGLADSRGIRQEACKTSPKPSPTPSPPSEADFISLGSTDDDDLSDTPDPSLPHLGSSISRTFQHESKTTASFNRGIYGKTGRSGHDEHFGKMQPSRLAKSRPVLTENTGVGWSVGSLSAPQHSAARLPPTVSNHVQPCSCPVDSCRGDCQWEMTLTSLRTQEDVYWWTQLGDHRPYVCPRSSLQNHSADPVQSP